MPAASVSAQAPVLFVYEERTRYKKSLCEQIKGVALLIFRALYYFFIQLPFVQFPRWILSCFKKKVQINYATPMGRTMRKIERDIHALHNHGRLATEESVPEERKQAGKIQQAMHHFIDVQIGRIVVELVKGLCDEAGVIYGESDTIDNGVQVAQSCLQKIFRTLMDRQQVFRSAQLSGLAYDLLRSICDFAEASESEKGARLKKEAQEWLDLKGEVKSEHVLEKAAHRLTNLLFGEKENARSQSSVVGMDFATFLNTIPLNRNERGVFTLMIQSPLGGPDGVKSFIHKKAEKHFLQLFKQLTKPADLLELVEGTLIPWMAMLVTSSTVEQVFWASDAIETGTLLFQVLAAQDEASREAAQEAFLKVLREGIKEATPLSSNTEYFPDFEKVVADLSQKLLHQRLKEIKEHFAKQEGGQRVGQKAVVEHIKSRFKEYEETSKALPEAAAKKIEKIEAACRKNGERTDLSVKMQAEFYNRIGPLIWFLLMEKGEYDPGVAGNILAWIVSRCSSVIPNTLKKLVAVGIASLEQEGEEMVASSIGSVGEMVGRRLLSSDQEGNEVAVEARPYDIHFRSLAAAAHDGISFGMKGSSLSGFVSTFLTKGPDSLGRSIKNFVKKSFSDQNHNTWLIVTLVAKIFAKESQPDHSALSLPSSS